MSTPQRRPALLLPTLFMLVGVAILCSLGTWQIKRLEWKQGLLGAIETQYKQDASKTPLNADSAPITRGYIEGTYNNEKSFKIGPRTHDGKPGFHLITPLKTNAGYVLVNRGWVPLDKQSEAAPSQKTKVIGLLRAPQSRNHFTPKNIPTKDIWYDINLSEIAAAKGIGAGALWPLMLYAEPTNNQEGTFPVAEATKPQLKNDHLQYAIFWFSMAGILVIIYGLRFLKRD